jgi:hypothetical protein
MAWLWLDVLSAWTDHSSLSGSGSGSGSGSDLGVHALCTVRLAQLITVR